MPARRTHVEVKRAARQLVRRVGGIKVAARLLDRSPSQVQRYTDEQSPDDIGVSQVLVLERAAGEMIVTGMLAHLQGGAVLALAQSKRNGIGARQSRAASAVIAWFELLSEAQRRDPNIHQSDIPRLVRQGHETLSRLSDLQAALHARGAQ